MIEMPEALADLGYAGFAQRGSRVIYRNAEDREIYPDLRRWMVEGLEFADEEIARTADFRRHTFGLHWFETWEQGLSWLREDGTHEPWADCPDCAVARQVHEAVWASHDV